MCGIFAYQGDKNSLPLLIEGLRRLEYRGYDSAGVFALTGDGQIFLEKSVGKVSNLATKIEKSQKKEGAYHTGIAHTRWATHGGVTEANSHPHRSMSGRYTIVHNGIIENYHELKTELIEKGYIFQSETDTEVIAHLLEELKKEDPIELTEALMSRLVGAYSLIITDLVHPNRLIGIKLGSPMIIGVSKYGHFIASDVNALAGVAEEYINLEDREVVIITPHEYHVYSLGQEIEKNREQITVEASIHGTGGYETYTEKEIHEIPEVFMNALSGRINFATREITNETLEHIMDLDIDRIEIIASGSSAYAGMVGAHWIRELAEIPTEVRISSEFLYDTFLPDMRTLYVFMSQSGETADVRESVRLVKEKGCHTFGIVNVVGSSIARMCERGLYCHAGVEIGVASTKNIISQLAILLLMALALGSKRSLQIKDMRIIIDAMQGLPDIFRELLTKIPEIDTLVEKYSQYPNFFFLGRGRLYGIAAEGSLKLKELSYIHAEAYASGELKHGPLALISESIPTLVVNLTGNMTEKTESNTKEIKARNGKVIGIITKGMADRSDLYDDTIEVPQIHPILTPFLPLIPMWLLAVKMAKKLGKDVDKPQNLAKSVTVE